MTTTAAAVAVVVASVALSGCGGDDDPATSQPGGGGAGAPQTPARSREASTKREFIRRADALCAEAKQRVARISEAIGAKIANEDAAGVAAELRKGLPIADAFLRRMRALAPPKGDQAIVDKYLDTVAEQRRRIPPLIEALKAEDISTIEVLATELRRENDRTKRLAKAYGLRSCAGGTLP